MFNPIALILLETPVEVFTEVEVEGRALAAKTPERVVVFTV